MDIKKYVVNGKVYDTLEDVPVDLRHLIENASEIQVKAPEANVSIITPIAKGALAEKAKSAQIILYLILTVISLIENGAFYTMAKTTGIKEQNFFISLIVSMVIAWASQKLATRKLSNINNTYITFTNEFSFINNLILAVASSGYTVLLNLLYYIVLVALR